MSDVTLEGFTRKNGHKVARHQHVPSITAVGKTDYFIGRDFDGNVWAVGTELNTPTTGVIAKYDARGNLLKLFTYASRTFLAGAIDTNGSIWVGDTTTPYDLLKINADTGVVEDSLVLNDGANDGIPLGMVARPLSAQLVVAVQTVSTNTLRLYLVNINTGAVTTTGAESPSLGTIVDRLGLVRDPSGQWWIASRNSATTIVKWNAAINVDTPVVLSSVRNHGAFGIHYAHGYLWIGSRPVVPAAANDVQISKVDLAGTVVDEVIDATWATVSGFSHDATHVFAAVAGTGAGSRPHRVVKLDAGTMAIDDAFLFDGSNFNSTDGLGEALRDCLTLDEPFRIPLEQFGDALVWVAADDDHAQLIATEFSIVANRAPRQPKAHAVGTELIGALSQLTGAARPDAGLLGTRRSFLFASADEFRHTDAAYFSLGAWNALHDGSPITVAIVFHPQGGGAANQYLVNTMGVGANTETGFLLRYIEATENVQVRIGNGGGVDYVVDVLTPANSVPLNNTTIIQVSYDPVSRAAGEEVEIRIRRQDPDEYEIHVFADTAEVPDSGNCDAVFAVGRNTGSGSMVGHIGELICMHGTFQLYAQREIDQYMSRWQP